MVRRPPPRRALRRLVVALVPRVVVGFVVGGLPWWWANAHSGFASVERAADRSVFGGPFEVFFRYGLPMVLGLRRPIRLDETFASRKNTTTSSTQLT